MIKNGLAKFMIFATGAALGSVVTWKLVKTKYEKLAQEEIDSVKEVFSRRRKEETTDNEDTQVENTKEESKAVDIREVYTNKVNDLGYFNYSDIPKKETPEREVIKILYPEPEVIPPDEFGILSAYEEVTLYYFADGTLTDEYWVPIDEADIDNTVSRDALDCFGEWEDDCVYVRNDRLQIYYEILLDERNYSDCVTNYEEDEE